MKATMSPQSLDQIFCGADVVSADCQEHEVYLVMRPRYQSVREFELRITAVRTTGGARLHLDFRKHHPPKKAK